MTAAPSPVAGAPATPSSSTSPLSNVAHGFPDTSALTSFDALLDLADNAAATVRRLVPNAEHPEEDEP